MPRGGAATPTTLTELIDALPLLRAAGVRRAKVGAIEIEFGAAPASRVVEPPTIAPTEAPPADPKARSEWEKIAYMSSDPPTGSLPIKAS